MDYCRLIAAALYILGAVQMDDQMDRLQRIIQARDNDLSWSDNLWATAAVCFWPVFVVIFKIVALTGRKRRAHF